MSLTGPEKSVRLFYITYLWAGSHGTDILKAAFDFSDEHLLMKEMGFDQAEFMNPKELFLRLAVNRLRYEQGCYLSDPPFETVSFGDMLGSIRNYCDGFIKEPEQAHLQARFFCFMMYFSPFYLHMDDFRIKMLEDYFEELQEDESPIAKLLIEFESFFFNELVTAETVDYEESFLLHINTFLTLMNYLVYEDKIPLIMDITEYPTSYERAAFSELQQQILAFFKKISRRKDYQWLARCVEPFAADITDAVLPTYKACFNQQYLNVAIVTVPDYFILQTIRDLLHQFTFVNVTYTNQNDPNVDFYITTFQKLLPEGVDKPYFVVPLIKDYDCQTELFELLWAAYKEEMINKITFEALERDLDQNLETIQEVINEDFEE